MKDRYIQCPKCKKEIHIRIHGNGEIELVR